MKTNTLYQRIKKNDEQGFTLVEVLVAIAVFSIGVMAMVVMQHSSILSNDLSRKSTEAGLMAADLVERLNSLPYNDPVYLTPGLHVVGAPNVPLDIREGQFSLLSGANLISDIELYRIQYMVVPNQFIPNTKTIAVTVWYRYSGDNDWVIHSGYTREVSLVTVKPDTI